MDDKNKPVKTGTFLKMPYDWRKPTKARTKSRLWNAEDRHIFTPKTYGWGYSFNFYEIAVRLHLKKRPANPDA
jgi:hypothetical protein